MLRFQISLAARYLWGRKLRTFLTTLAILFGTLLIFLMNIILPTMMESFQTNMMAASGQVDMSITHTSGEAFDENLISRIRPIEGIRAIGGSLSRTINIPAGYYGRADVAALTLSGIDPKAAPTLRSYRVQEGRFLRTSDDYAAVITKSLAETLNIGLGDELNVPTAEGNASFEIVGLLPARTLPGNEEVLITLYQAQKLLDLPDRINTIEINLKTLNDTERESIMASIEATLGEDFAVGGLSSGAELFASLQMGQAIFNLFGFLALFMGGFIIFNTFRTIVAERRHDIGMLRSIGASRSTIVGLILIEGILQGVFGTLAGISLGYLLGIVLLDFMEPIMNQFMNLDIGAPVINPGLIPVTVLLGVGVTLIAGLLPAISAGRMTPLEALRPSIGSSSRRALGVGTIIGIILIGGAIYGLLSGSMSLVALGGLLFLIGLVLIAPVMVRPITNVFGAIIGLVIARQGTGTIAESNLTRQPGRAAITASATMVGLAIIVAIGGLVFSLVGTMLGIMQRSLGSDYLLMPPSVAVWKTNIGAGDDLARSIRNIPGVGVVSSMRYASATVNGDPVSLLGIDPQTYPQVASLTFQEGDFQTAFTELARERALIANGIYAAQAGLKVGDIVQVSTPRGRREYRIAAIAGDFLNAKITTAYISQDNLYKDFRKDEDVFIQINLAPGADPVYVEDRMKSILRDYPQFSLVSGKNYLQDNIVLFKSATSVYFVLLGVLILPSLIALVNTLAIGVIERTREIGMLRAIGATRKQVRRTIIAESLLLSGIGTAFGLFAGLYLGYVMLLGLSVGGFPVEYTFPYVGLISAIAAGLIFGVIASLIPARQAAGLNIIRALRYE